MPGRFYNLEFGGQRQEAHAGSEELRSRDHAAEDYLAQANDDYRWGRFDSALQRYTRALREDRALIPAWVGQVQMLVQLDECHEARVWSDKALELFRGNGELLAAKAQACIRLQDHKAGLACSDASLQAPGNSPWRWQVRGEVLLAREQKHFEDCFQKAVLEVAADWFDYVVVARIYYFYNRITNALGYLTKALEAEPAHGYIWFQMGNCQKALALDAAASNSYLRCLDLKPDYREAEQALTALAAGRPLLSRLGAFLRRWRRS